MTDFNDDKPKAQEEKSFKEQILGDLEEANRLRKQQEEELSQKEIEDKETARRMAKFQAEYDYQLKNEQQETKNQSTKPDFESENQDIPLENQGSDVVAVEEVKQISRTKEIDQAVLSSILDNQFSNNQNKQVDSEAENTDRVAVSETSNQALDFDDSKSANSMAFKSKDTKEKGSRDSKAIRHRRRQKTNGLAKRIALISITTIIVILAAVVFFTYRYVSDAIGALDSSSTGYVTVEIPQGSGNKYIGQILKKAGVIKDATIFNYYTKFKNYSNFQSGYYNLQASMDLDKISKLLQKGGTTEPEKPALGKILITEGETIKQISNAVAKNSAASKGDNSSTPYTAESFLKTIQSADFIEKMVAKYPTLLANLPSKDKATYQLEGYLFPATYSYYKNTTIENLAEQMISTMNSYMSKYYDTISSKGMTVNEVLTLASLVEKEGSTDDDRRNIASVFYNRLNTGMALQSNIAILYAQGILGEKTTLAEDASIDTSINSPYNDYTNTSLMPGPVDSPSLSAIEATVNPASTDYYYFVADVTTGEVYYAETYDEHKANVEKYVNSKISK